MSIYSDLQLDGGQYVPQYAGAPLGEIERTADKLATRHYQNLASASQLQILANQMKAQLLPGAKGYVDEHITALDTALQDMARAGGENSTARINALATALQGDQGILNASLRSKEFAEQSKLIDQLKSQGHTPLYNQERRQALLDAAVGDEVYNMPYDAQVEPYKDPGKDMENVWSRVKPDSIESALKADMTTSMRNLLGRGVAGADPDMAMFLSTITKEGVSASKIGEQLENAWQQYKNTESYQQQVGPLVGKSEATAKEEFLRNGLLGVYQNLKREYVRNPAWQIKEEASKPTYTMDTGIPVPGTETPYTVNGTAKGRTTADVRGSYADAKIGISATKDSEIVQDTGEKEFHPQYIKDLNAIKEIEGLPEDLEPGSEEAKAAVGRYNAIRQQRVSNTWVRNPSEEEQKAFDFDLERRFSQLQFLDPASGEVITPYKKGNNSELSDEFVELTGGDPSKFALESIMDPKNHITDFPQTDKSFVTAKWVTANYGKDGVKRFLISSKAAQTRPADVNENVIYRTTLPGQEVQLSPSVKAKELYGFQQQALKDKYGFTDEAWTNYLDNLDKGMVPIEATINGETMLFDSPRHLAETLEQKGIELNLKRKK